MPDCGGTSGVCGSWGQERGYWLWDVPIELIRIQYAEEQYSTALINAFEPQIMQAPLYVWWARDSLDAYMAILQRIGDCIHAVPFRCRLWKEIIKVLSRAPEARGAPSGLAGLGGLGAKTCHRRSKSCPDPRYLQEHKWCHPAGGHGYRARRLANTIRGFSTDGECFVNGFRQLTFTSPFDVANIERADVLKGPASVLFGSGSNPGGIVNFITKQPLSSPQYHGAVSYGSDDYVRPEFDITGPLIPGSSDLLYRLNFAYTDTDGFIDFSGSQSRFVAPALTWNIGERTRVNLEFNYNDIDGTPETGAPAVKPFLDLSEKQFLGEPEFNDLNTKTESWFFDFEHGFTDQWKFRVSANYNSHRAETQESFISELVADPANCFAGENDPDGTLACRSLAQQVTDAETYTVRAELLGKFDTGPLQHTALIGGEYFAHNERYGFFPVTDPSDNTGFPIDIFDPTYTRGFTFEQLGPDPLQDTLINTRAFFFEDLITLIPTLKVASGAVMTMRRVNSIFSTHYVFRPRPIRLKKPSSAGGQASFGSLFHRQAFTSATRSRSSRSLLRPAPVAPWRRRQGNNSR
jgi:Outer membrane receptor proteins, mostly Fe transport